MAVAGTEKEWKERGGRCATVVCAFVADTWHSRASFVANETAAARQLPPSGGQTETLDSPRRLFLFFSRTKVLNC